VSDNLPERRATGSEIVFYQTEDDRSRIEVRLEDKTVWLARRLLAELCQTTVANVSVHQKDIFADAEVARIELLGNTQY
jgi:hypothetical protein